MTFLDTLTDLVDPIAGDSKTNSQGKTETAYIKDPNDALEDIRLSLVGKPFRSVKAYSPVPTLVLDSADAFTNWVASPTGSVDTTIKTTGTGSVKLPVRGNSAISNGYLNVPGAPATSGKFRVVFDFRWAVRGILNTQIADVFEMFVASGAGITGTVVASAIPKISQGMWLSLSLPVTGISTLGSFGIRHKGAAFVTPTTTAGYDVWIDNVRWEATELDVAIASAPGVIVPADYVPTVPQNPISIPPTKTVLDLRPGYNVVSDAKERHGTEFGIVPGTATDITAILSYAIGQIPRGGKLTLAPGQYVMNGQIDVWGLTDIDLSMYGCTFYRTVQNQPDGFFVFKTCQRINFRGAWMFGNHTDTTLGSALTSVASNRLSAQQSDREDSTTYAEAILWTQNAGTSLGNDAKRAKRPKGVSFQINNSAVGGTATIGMSLPTGASAPMDVEPSTSYRLSAWFLPHDEPATFAVWAARTCEVVVKWYTAAGAVAATASATVSAVETDEKVWALATGAVTSPADAAKASLECRVLATAGQSGIPPKGECHDIDMIGLQRTTPRVLGTSGTTILLTQPGDEARLGSARVYARDKDLRTKCDFVLSDTTHVANDCEIIVRDDETGEQLGTMVLPLLTSTPTTYQIIYTISVYADQFNELARLLRFSVRKNKGTANTVTVTSATEYGRNLYNAATDSGKGISVSDTDPDSNDLLFEDLLCEGTGGDALIFTSGGNRCTARRVISRANQRQGMSITGGADNGFEDCDIYGPGRSGIDFEPPTAGRIIKRGFLRNIKVFRPTNAGMAWGPWCLSEFCTIDGMFIWKANVSNNFGGKYTTISNIISAQPVHAPTQKDITIQGVDCVISNVIAEYGWTVDNTTKTYIDDNGNVVAVASSGNRGSNFSIRTGGAGYSVLGDNSVTPATSRGTVLPATLVAGTLSFSVTIPAQTDITYAVFLELSFQSTWRITTRTTSSFTVELGVAVPTGGGTCNWMTAGV